MLPILFFLLAGGTTPVPAPPDIAGLLRETRAMTLAGRWDAAIAALDAAQAQAGAGGGARAAALRTERGRVLMDRSFFHRKDPAPARAALAEGLRLAKAAGDPSTAAKASQALAQLDYNEAFESKDWAKPRAAFESVLAAREKLGDRLGMSETLFYLGLTFEQDGQPGPALQRYEKSLALAEEVGDLVQQSYPRRHIGGIQEERGELAAAAKNIAAEVELRVRGGFAVGVPFALLHQADFVTAHGSDPKEAVRLLEDAAAKAEKCGSTRALSAARAELSHRAAAEGDSRRAFAMAEQALQAARAYGAASEIRAAEALVGAAGRTLPN